MASMRMSLLMVSLLLGTFACSGPRFALDENAENELSKLPGCIGLKLFQKDRTFDVSLEKGELTIQGVSSTRPGQPNELSSVRAEPEKQTAALPALDGFEYYGPCEVSPDKTHEVFAIACKASWFYPTGFVVVQQGTNKVVCERKSRNIWSTVQGVAWSADSKMFAVLEMDTRRKSGVMERLFDFLGLPVEEGDFSLSVYDLEGHLLAKSHVASGLATPGGRLSWRN